MKQLILLTVALLIGSFGSARADLHIDSPSALLAKAETGKIACREVVLDLLANIPEMRDPALFDSYFRILDALNQIAVKVDLDSIYPDAIKNLGTEMGAGGIRWLSISKDQEEKILYYHKWMGLDVAYTFYSSAEVTARSITDSQELHQTALNIEALLAALPKIYPDKLDIVQNYRRTISELAARVLTQKDLSEEDALFWLGKISVTSGYSLAVDSLQADVLALTRKNFGDINRIAKRSLVLALRMRANPSETPIYLQNQVGDLLVSLVLHKMDFNVPYAKGEFENFLDLLNARGLQALAQQWAAADRIPSGEYVDIYRGLTKLLLVALNQSQLDHEAYELAQFEERMLAPIIAKAKKIEGTYTLKDLSGKEWIFNVVLARQSVLFVSLMRADKFARKGFFEVGYSVEEETFVASTSDATTILGSNLLIKFRPLGNGEIEVREPMGMGRPGGEQVLRGKKVEEYPDFFLKPNEQLINPDGIYKGLIPYGKDSSLEMSLVVTSFRGYTMGRLADKNGALYLDLNIGTRGTDGVLYLTTGKLGMGYGRLGNGTWLQLRGIVTKDEFRGLVVNGGAGITKREFVLKKVSN